MRGGRRWGAAIVGSMLALGAVAACEPVRHDQLVVKEASSAPVTFELLSGDGAYVVVDATAPSATVPGAGRWRVDRLSGEALPLPGGTTATKISADGSRVLVTTGATSMLWSAGTALTPPAGTVMSEDLTYGAFVDSSGALKTWETATQAVAPVEPAPPPGASLPQGISDDGRTVHYRLYGALDRFVDLDTGAVVERENLDGQGSELLYHFADRFTLAPSGYAFLHVHEEGVFDPGSLSIELDVSWAELVAVPSGEVVRRFTNTSGQAIVAERVSDDGRQAWLHREARIRAGASTCVFQPFPTPISCVRSSSAVAFWAGGTRTFVLAGFDLGDLRSSANGRFLVLDQYDHPLWFLGDRGPVQVLDAFSTPGREVLADPAPVSSADAHISDDGRLVVSGTSSGNGWYEFTPSP